MIALQSIINGRNIIYFKDNVTATDVVKWLNDTAMEYIIDELFDQYSCKAKLDSEGDIYVLGESDNHFYKLVSVEVVDIISGE